VLKHIVERLLGNAIEDLFLGEWLREVACRFEVDVEVILCHDGGMSMECAHQIVVSFSPITPCGGG
jgi:hypothetical protein